MIADKDRCPVTLTSHPSPLPAAFNRSFVARPRLVREVLQAMTTALARATSPEHLGRTELVLAELLNNVTQHGRGMGAGPAPFIHLGVVVQPQGLVCSVSDDGGLLPRLCLRAPAPDPQDYPEGGFGWYLIGHLTQSLIYFREGERNYLAFTVPTDAPRPS
ncbi:ATP-binding protein [Paracoccus jeotgali]|uniref:ATP-binding protein n=1 Tax=Paracoccus jeotgali TaxID=2065379 RepID=A0A2K9MFF5_9RHOB|nr:ATP-binding protein [Paracoccus jeotgali]AUM73255.1 ATP-binding protein [Paracoccus jeotgali]